MSIEVQVRVRPNGDDQIWSCADTVIYTSRQQKGLGFQYNRVHSTATTNEELFRCIEPLVRASFEGRNVTLMAYGQTGSGKTYSMIGNPKDRGLAPRAADLLLNLASHSPGTTLNASAVEIYNESLRDLLTEQPKEVQLHDAPTTMGMFDHAMVPITSWADYVVFSSRAETFRKYGITDLNEHSSRSHTLIILEIQRPKEQPSTLMLVDLAGSECAAKANTEGLQLREGGYINRSLLTLGNVVEAIVDVRPHIPFRDSKLTRMLRPCLEGNGLSYILCCINPSQDNYDQTVAALRFAQRAMKIKTDPTQLVSWVPPVIYQLQQQFEEEAKKFAEDYQYHYELGVAEGYQYCRDYINAKVAAINEEVGKLAHAWDAAKLALIAHERLQYIRYLHQLHDQLDTQNRLTTESSARVEKNQTKQRAAESELQELKSKNRQFDIQLAEMRVAITNAESDNEFKLNEVRSTLLMPADVVVAEEEVERVELQVACEEEQLELWAAFERRLADEFGSVADDPDAAEGEELLLLTELEKEKKELEELEAACAMLTEEPISGADGTAHDDLHLETKIFAVEEEESTLRARLASGLLGRTPEVGGRPQNPVAGGTSTPTPEGRAPTPGSAKKSNAELHELLRRTSLRLTARTTRAAGPANVLMRTTPAKTPPLRTPTRDGGTPGLEARPPSKTPPLSPYMAPTAASRAAKVSKAKIAKKPAPKKASKARAVKKPTPAATPASTPARTAPEKKPELSSDSSPEVIGIAARRRLEGAEPRKRVERELFAFDVLPCMLPTKKRRKA